MKVEEIEEDLYTASPPRSRRPVGGANVSGSFNSPLKRDADANVKMEDIEEYVQPHGHGYLLETSQRETGPENQLTQVAFGSQRMGRNGKYLPDIDQIPKEQLVCGNCSIQGHAVRDCTRNLDNEGFINACAFCNTRLHNVLSCSRMQMMKLGVLYHNCVRLRGVRAPIRGPWNF